MTTEDILKLLNDVFVKEPTPEELARLTIDGLGYDLTRVGQLSATLIDGLLDIHFTYQYPVTCDYIKISFTPAEGTGEGCVQRDLTAR